MPDQWGFCEGWKGGALTAWIAKKIKEFEKHMANCAACKAAQKKHNAFWKEFEKCGSDF